MPDTPCARYWGSDGTLCATHNRRFASPSLNRCGGSPTMPDTLTPEEIDAIRARHTGEFDWESDCPDTIKLLAHIDGLTAERDALNHMTPEQTREARRLLLLAAGAVDRAILADPSHPMIQHLNLADTALRMLSDVLPRLGTERPPMLTAEPTLAELEAEYERGYRNGWERAREGCTALHQPVGLDV